MGETLIAIVAAAAFLIVFPLFWMTVIFIISRVGGWAALARRFPAEKPSAGEPFNWRSGRFRLLTHYSHCGDAVDKHGVRLNGVGWPRHTAPSISVTSCSFYNTRASYSH